MASVNFTYDEISDTLYITFGKNQPARGIELNEDFLLRIDPETHAPIGLTVLNYKQVAQSEPVSLTGLADLPVELVKTVLDILETSPVAHLVNLTKDHPPQIQSRIHESRIEDVVGV